MIVLAIIATIGSIGLSILILFANSMRSSPGEFKGKLLLAGSWIMVIIMWLSWFFN